MADLDVVGLGINPWWHLTLRGRQLIEDADEVLYLVPDPLAGRWVERMNPATTSLGAIYQEHEHRRDVYDAIVEAILAPVRAGKTVCAAFYGHPGVFVDPGHDAVAAARREGFTAEMHPGISAEDCLYADLGIDPADRGCQTYEAGDFLDRHASRLDVTADLVLWQAGAVGEETTDPASPPRRLPELVDALVARYGADHPVIIYEAGTQPVFGPRIDEVPTGELASAELRLHSTLYVRAVSQPESAGTT